MDSLSILSSSQIPILDSREKKIKKYLDLSINKISNPDDKKLRKACEGFEAIFLKYLLSSMRKTVKDGILTSSGSEKIFRDMMDSELCDIAAKSRALGIADMLYKDIKAKIVNQSDSNNIKGEGL